MTNTRLVKCKMVCVLIHMSGNKSLLFNSETLCSFLDSDPYIVCLQLPIGAARPFITEVEEEL